MATAVKRKRWNEVRAGDSIKSVPTDAGNGRLWSGEVTAVATFMSQALIGVPSREMVRVTVEVHGRSLCADDLVHGFGYRTRNSAFVAPTYTLCHPVNESLFRRVKHRGREMWTGYEVYGESVTDEG